MPKEKPRASKPRASKSKASQPTANKEETLSPEAQTRVKELIDKRKYLDAIHYSGDEPTMLGYVVHAGLLEASNGFAAMERAIDSMPSVTTKGGSFT